VLHLQRTRWPTVSTYTYVLERLDEQEVTRVIQECLTRAETSQLCGEEPSRLATQAGREQSDHIAMDGKTMRGTLSHEAATQGPVHLLSLYEVKTGKTGTELTNVLSPPRRMKSVPPLPWWDLN